MVITDGMKPVAAGLALGILLAMGTLAASSHASF